MLLRPVTDLGRTVTSNNHRFGQLGAVAGAGRGTIIRRTAELSTGCYCRTATGSFIRPATLAEIHGVHLAAADRIDQQL